MYALGWGKKCIIDPIKREKINEMGNKKERKNRGSKKDYRK
jgi:hypothetical protein